MGPCPTGKCCFSIFYVSFWLSTEILSFLSYNPISYPVDEALGMLTRSLNSHEGKNKCLHEWE